MGMLAGSLFSYQPAQVTLPSNSLSIESEAIKIDDRNVMLNYYSDNHKQYIDIELPAEIYNFLQTYLPEKKFGIVMELEKQTAIKQAMEKIDSGDFLKIPQVKNVIPDEEEKIYTQTKNNLEVIKDKIEKLKVLHESGILTDEEFAEEKKNILKSL